MKDLNKNFIIPPKNIFAPSKVGKISIVFHQNTFYIESAQYGRQEIPRHRLANPLDKLTSENIERFLEVGYISVSAFNNQFALTAKVRGPGGGPVAGYIGYWATKVLCYGVATAAATTAIAATGGAAGAATGAIAAGVTAGASTGATVVGGAIAGSGLAGEAATLTAATINASGSLAAAATAVESASLGVGAALTAIPFLP